MPKFEQRTIEYFFNKYKIKDPDQKAKLLLDITETIYDYNNHVVRYEKEADELKKKQLIDSIEDIEIRIEDIFNDFKKT